MSYFQPLKMLLLLACLVLAQPSVAQAASPAAPAGQPEPAELPNLAGVLADGKWGYIDSGGRFVLPPVYEEARSFSRAGVAIVKQNGSWALIDTQGKAVPLPGTPYASVVGSSGLVAVEHDGKWSIADLSGNATPLPESGDKISFAICFFAQPYCKVVRRTAEGETGESLVGADGMEVVPPGFEQVNLPAGGEHLIATDTAKKDWLLSLEGEVLGGPFEYIAYARKGEACVMQDGKFGLLSLEGGRPGAFIIQPEFDDVILFQEDGLAAGFAGGLAVVEINGRSGIIDRSGGFVLRPSFDIIQALPDGGPWVASRDGEKFGLLGQDGEFIDRPVFDDFFTLLPGGKTVFKRDGKWSVYSREGLALKVPVFDAVGQTTPGGALTAVSLDGLWGFVDADGELVIKPAYRDTAESGWTTEIGGLKAAKALNREAVRWIRAGRPNPLSER